MTTRTMSSFPAFVGRVFWMMVGPFALATLALSIAGQADGWTSPSDLLYFIVLAGMLIGRWTEFRFRLPMTASGEPATSDHLRRYVLGLGLLGLVVWVAANLIGNRAIGLLG
jgi:hypothetical protein